MSPRKGDCQGITVRLYRALSRVFPESFTAKVAFLAFVAVHVPLLALVSYAVAQQGSIWEEIEILALALGATVFGAFASILGIRAILAPVYRIEAAMTRYVRERRVALLPMGYRDEVGRLMTSVNHLMTDVVEELDAATRAAETDPLTGLLNRRGFDRAVPPELVGAVLQIDLDHFKAINDEWGHATGDATLVAVSDALSASLRTRDVLARMGGEEFAVYFDEIVESRALDVADRLRARVRRDVQVKGRPVTVSVGLAVTDRPVSRETMLALADDATYAAKTAGRDQVKIADTVQAA